MNKFLNNKNTIIVEMPCFWINKNNPRAISFDPDNTEKWRPIHSEFYLTGIPIPKENEIAYSYKGSEYTGFLLTN